MRPPYCVICPRNLHDDVPEGVHSSEYFTLVEFRDYWFPDTPGWCGHPHGAEWFCWEHAEAAEELSHLASGEAIDRLRERFAAD